MIRKGSMKHRRLVKMVQHWNKWAEENTLPTRIAIENNILVFKEPS